MKDLLRDAAFVVCGFLLTGSLIAAIRYSDPCPPEFRIGMTYAQVRDGPCPDIEKQAFDRHDNLVSYYCPSKSVAVLGSVVTGKMVGFVLVDFDPRQK